MILAVILEAINNSSNISNIIVYLIILLWYNNICSSISNINNANNYNSKLYPYYTLDNFIHYCKKKDFNVFKIVSPHLLSFLICRKLGNKKLMELKCILHQLYD